jgi:predicted metal-dependent hydrolase
MTKHVAQLDLFEDMGGMTPAQFYQFLVEDLPCPLRLVFTRNRVSLLTVKFERHEISVRAHEAFLKAPREVLDALKRYLYRRSKTSWKVIQEYVYTIDTGKASRVRRRVTRTRGAYYDLEAIRDRVNARFFDKPVKCDISWGRITRSKKRRRRSYSICFGSCDQEERFIRINPKLDNPRVPSSFVEYIIYHEMLHLAIPSRRQNGRWQHHGPAFKQVEDRYPGIERMRRLAQDLTSKL